MNKQKVLKQTKEFWAKFYSKKEITKTEPSSFALWSMDRYIKKSDNIFEIGCGNGRDSFAFIENGNSIFAIDACKIAISDNNQYLKKLSKNNQATFKSIDFNDLYDLEYDFLDKIDIFYSRFVLHAIPEELEDMLLTYMYQKLPKNGKIIHEFRTNHDQLMNYGEELSENERVTDHYRRFIDTKKFRNKLSKLGFKELYFIESNGLAIFGKDNPVVARVVGIKR